MQSEQSSQGQSQTEETKQTSQGEPQIYRPAPEYGAYGPVNTGDGSDENNSANSTVAGDSSANDGEESSRNTVNGDYARSDDNLENPFLPYGDPYSGNIKNSRFGNPYDLSDDAADGDAADGDAGDNQDDAVHGEVQVVNQGSNQNPNQGPVSYTHLTLPTTLHECRSRWSPYH